MMESGETLLNNHWLGNRGGSLAFLVEIHYSSYNTPHICPSKVSPDSIMHQVILWQILTRYLEYSYYKQFLIKIILMKSTFENIWLFFHRPVGLVELLILYACVQIYTSDYRLISKTVKTDFITQVCLGKSNN
jgi:hypothetical protein